MNSDEGDILGDNEEVARDMEFGIVHDPNSEHGDEHPNVRTDYLDAEECWACRQCWGYPGTKEELDDLLGEQPTTEQEDGQQSLAGWTA